MSTADTAIASSRKLQYDESTKEDDARKVKEKFPDRIPIYVTGDRSTNTSTYELDKRRFLAPGDMKVGQFMFVLRKRMQLPPTHAMFVYNNGRLLMNTMSIQDVYHNRSNKDQSYLDMNYAFENTFGSLKL